MALDAGLASAALAITRAVGRASDAYATGIVVLDPEFADQKRNLGPC